MTKPMCPNCKQVDRGALLPSDHDGKFFFTRCGNCNHGYMYNAKGEVQSGHREQVPSKELCSREICEDVLSMVGWLLMLIGLLKLISGVQP